MKKEGLIGIATAVAILGGCKADVAQEINLVDCENGPRTGSYELEVQQGRNIHLGNLEFATEKTIREGIDLIIFPDRYATKVNILQEPNKHYDVAIDPRPQSSNGEVETSHVKINASCIK